MNDVVLGGQVDGLGVLDHVLDVVLGDFAVGGNHRMHPAVVESTEMAAGDPEVDAADFHVGHLLRFHVALRISSAASAGSTISPLRTPRNAPGRGR